MVSFLLFRCRVFGMCEIGAVQANAEMPSPSIVSNCLQGLTLLVVLLC